MTARLRHLQSPVALVLVFAGLAALARTHGERLRPPPPDRQSELPPFPAEVARRMAFGFASLASDGSFLDAIQVYGARQGPVTAAAGVPDDRLLNSLLTFSTDLDPKFSGAYRFAGHAMPRHTIDGKAMNVLQTEVLLEKGARERADDWHIPFLLGFVQSYYLGKFTDAGRNLAVAAKNPDAPAYLGLLATRAAADGGDLDFAEQMANAMFQQATEDSAKEEWARRLLDLRMERDLRAIEAAAARYAARTGAQAGSLEALVQAGELARMPQEPHGGRYELDGRGEARSTAARRLRIRGRLGTQAGLEVQ